MKKLLIIVIAIIAAFCFFINAVVETEKEDHERNEIAADKRNLIFRTENGETITIEDIYHQACSNGDFDKARATLDKIYAKYSEKYGSGWKTEAESFAGRYAAGAKFVLGEELNYLAGQNEGNLSLRIMGIFNGIQMLGEKLPEGTEYGSSDNAMCYNCYVFYVDIKNTLAKRVVDYAILLKDKDLAMLAYRQMEDSPCTKIQKKEEDSVEHIYYSTDDKDKMLKKIRSNFTD